MAEPLSCKSSTLESCYRFLPDTIIDIIQTNKYTDKQFKADAVVLVLLEAYLAQFMLAPVPSCMNSSILFRSRRWKQHNVLEDIVNSRLRTGAGEKSMSLGHGGARTRSALGFSAGWPCARRPRRRPRRSPPRSGPRRPLQSPRKPPKSTRSTTRPRSRTTTRATTVTPTATRRAMVMRSRAMVAKMEERSASKL